MGLTILFVGPQPELSSLVNVFIKITLGINLSGVYSYIYFMKGIYKITNPNGKIYIGQCQDFNKRMALYRLGHCKKQIALYASIIKHGWDNHKAEFIEACDNLDEREIYYINLFNTFNTPQGLNLRGGGSVHGWCDDSKAKLSASMAGRKKPELAERNKLSKGISKETPSWKGRKHTEETKAKMALSAKIRERSPEMKAKMSASAKAKVFTREHRAKMLESRLNSEKVGKKVIDISTNEVFKSLTYLCKLKGLSYGAMKLKLRGVNKNNTIYQYL